MKNKQTIRLCTKRPYAISRYFPRVMLCVVRINGFSLINNLHVHSARNSNPRDVFFPNNQRVTIAKFGSNAGVCCGRVERKK